MNRLFCILLAIGSVSAARAQEIKPAHQYDFSRSLADSMGGAAMENGGGTLFATRYQFRAGKGPSVSNALASPEEYTIELVVKLDNSVRYRALVNFDNLKHDRALFVHDGSVHFYPIGKTLCSSTLDVLDRQWHRIVFTRDRATATVACYVDGRLRLTAPDPEGQYIANGNAAAILHFCRDNNGEESPGELEQIRIFHRALTAAEIAALPPLSAILPAAIVPIPTRPARIAESQAAIIVPATPPAVPPPLAKFADPNPSEHNGFGQTIVALSTGNVAITSPQADIGGVADCGAVYLFNGSTGTLISTLTGTTANDLIGNGGITPLANGNFVIRSQNWDHRDTPDVGAVTWANGNTGITGTVSETNSLIGTTTHDLVGLSGVTALPNGHYIVCSAAWDHGAATDAGAATWADGTTGITGPVSTENSLTGSAANHLVGSGGAVALADGDYLILSPAWDHGSTPNVGAVTSANGSTGIVGTVSPDNSRIGTK